VTVTDQAERTAKLATYLSTARWYAGKGREVEIHSVRRLTMPGAGDPAVRVFVVEVTAPDGTGRDHYQVPLSYYPEPREDLAHALIGSWTDEHLGEVHAYDAVHDHHAMALWLRGFTGAGAGTTASDDPDAVRFHVVGEPDLDPDARSTLLSGEQSNSSVYFGDTAMMKLFRRVTPGVNPDIEILAALTEAGSDHVATLYGWMDAPEPGTDDEPLQLGILQQFLTTASDGWGLALSSLRTLFADDVDTPRSSGGDFAAEAHRLGVAVAEVHETMARAFGTEQWGPDDLAALADTMVGRLDAAAAAVPEVAELAPSLRPLLDGVRRVEGPVTIQRVHGDLHLGQTLRTVRGWKIIDFEGEPAKPLAERRRPDSPWRDVAGMLRSFDYAAEGSLQDRLEAVGDIDSSAAQGAREWAARNVNAFLAGYDEVCADDLDEALLTAYAVDKAVYEAVYEARNRPTWLSIPLAALRRLAATDPS
jgi:maltokinase